MQKSYNVGTKPTANNGPTQVGKPDDINPNATSVFGSRIPVVTPKNYVINIQEDGPSSKKGSDLLEIMPIGNPFHLLIKIAQGAGNEVGRSCVVMKYKGKTVMFDCGIHPGYTGLSALPYFDLIDPSSIDLLLVTQ